MATTPRRHGGSGGTLKCSRISRILHPRGSGGGVQVWHARAALRPGLSRTVAMANLGVPPLNTTMRVNAVVETLAAAATVAYPVVVFPAAATTPGVAEAARWFAVAIAALGVGCFRAATAKDDAARRPMAEGMIAYHIAIALAQIPRLTDNALKISAGGAATLHVTLGVVTALSLHKALLLKASKGKR